MLPMSFEYHRVSTKSETVTVFIIGAPIACEDGLVELQEWFAGPALTDRWPTCFCWTRP
jgi:hypothetical protein